MRDRFVIGLALSLLLVGIAVYPIAQAQRPSQEATSTPSDTVQIEALNPDANVRAAPTIEAERVGVIQPGERYAVRGQRFEWLLIEYPLSANGWAWVHRSVVNISGDTGTLPQVDPASLAPGQPTASSTPSAMPTHGSTPATTLTPTPSAGTMVPSPTSTAPDLAQLLPTFTPPASLPTALPLATVAAQTESDPSAEVERRLDLLEQAYVEQPVMLYYGDQVIVLDPAEIGFTLDIEAMRPRLTGAAETPFDIITTAIEASYDPDQLVVFLQDIAARYDQPAGPATFDSTRLMFEPGAPGLALDVNAARALIASVLYQPHLASRQVDLPLEPVVRGDLDDLQAAIVNYLVSRGIPYNTTTSVISIAVRDLDSGMETGLNEQVLHSATSTAKIGVLATYFRYIYEEPNAEMRFRLAAAIICSSNVDANLTMAIAGNGNSAAGIGNVNTTFCQAGATNTLINRNFFIGPAGEGAVPQDYYDPAGVTPCQSGDTASLDGTLSPDVDPDLQTTAADMSQFLAMIYHCAEKGAGLAERFPGEFTQTECQWMLEILRGTRFLHLAELGIPEGVSFAHKVGYGGEALGDAGIVFSPGGDYTLVIYIWDEEMDSLDTYALSRWNIVSEISRLIYNYFNPDAPLLTPRLPPNAFGGAACVLPNWPEATINLNNINAGRFDASGDPLPGACYDWPACRPFSGWEQ